LIFNDDGEGRGGRQEEKGKVRGNFKYSWVASYEALEIGE